MTRRRRRHVPTDRRVTAHGNRVPVIPGLIPDNTPANLDAALAQAHQLIRCKPGARVVIWTIPIAEAADFLRDRLRYPAAAILSLLAQPAAQHATAHLVLATVDLEETNPCQCEAPR